jgi:hypothetical protein
MDCFVAALLAMTGFVFGAGTNRFGSGSIGGAT